MTTSPPPSTPGEQKDSIKNSSNIFDSLSQSASKLTQIIVLLTTFFTLVGGWFVFQYASDNNFNSLLLASPPLSELIIWGILAASFYVLMLFIFSFFPILVSELFIKAFTPKSERSFNCRLKKFFSLPAIKKICSFFKRCYKIFVALPLVFAFLNLIFLNFFPLYSLFICLLTSCVLAAFFDTRPDQNSKTENTFWFFLFVFYLFSTLLVSGPLFKWIKISTPFQILCYFIAASSLPICLYYKTKGMDFKKILPILTLCIFVVPLVLLHFVAKPLMQNYMIMIGSALPPDTLVFVNPSSYKKIKTQFSATKYNFENTEYSLNGQSFWYLPGSKVVWTSFPKFDVLSIPPDQQSGSQTPPPIPVSVRKSSILLIPCSDVNPSLKITVPEVCPPPQSGK